MTSSTFPARLAMLAAMVALAGCAAKTPNLDGRFGMAAATLKMQQQITPPPAVNGQQVTRLDGPAGKAAYDNYVKSYTEPKAQEGALAIGVGR